MKSGLNSEIFDKFAKIAGGLMNTEIENWKKQGGKVMGYLCPVIPEELIVAAGLLPFRIRGTGSTSTSIADAYYNDVNCDFPRHCFNQALLGKYDFLDGIIANTCCDTLLRFADNWKHAGLKTPFVYLLDNAHAAGEPMVGQFLVELNKLKGSLEKQFNVEITDQKLWAAIKLCNETKGLQQKLYGLRKLPSPPITGTEVMTVMVAGLSMPKEQYNKDLQALLDELAGVKDAKKYSLRLMIVGSGNDDSLLSDIIEGLGAIVVTDSTCFGARLMAKTVAETGTDPLYAIAKYQVMDVPFCPKTIGTHPQRKQFILDLAKDYQVDGIVGARFFSCDMWGAEFYMLKKDLEEIGIPFIWVEREYVPDSVGQLQTRVEAFIETINDK